MPAENSTQDSKASEPAKYIKGLEGIVAGQTVLSLVDGEASKLYPALRKTIAWTRASHAS